MVSEGQRAAVWEKMLAAEVRSMYFAELASCHTRYKQIITGAAFFLSSGAAATMAAKAPLWAPLAMAIVTALLTAYSMAVGLDRRSRTMAELHAEWNRLNADYERLWNHLDDADADARIEELRKRAREASERATELPFNEGMMQKWEKRVFSRYESASTTAA
jgi:hypothetical protein